MENEAEEPEHKHLKRLTRVFPLDPIYFVTTNTQGRRPILANAEIHAICQEVWQNARNLYGWSTGPYILMPDHVHFFCRTIEGADSAKPLSLFVGKWKEWVAKLAGRQNLITGSLWQPEFFDHVIRSSDSLREKFAYTWNNPVRAGLVEDGEDWPYRGNHAGWEFDR